MRNLKILIWSQNFKIKFPLPNIAIIPFALQGSCKERLIPSVLSTNRWLSPWNKSKTWSSNFKQPRMAAACKTVTPLLPFCTTRHGFSSNRFMSCLQSALSKAANHVDPRGALTNPTICINHWWKLCSCCKIIT